MKVIHYRNPRTGTVETAHAPVTSFILCLLFGPFYFLFKANYIHAIICFGVAWFTHGFSIVVYPFFVKKINTDFYEQKGWVRLDSKGQ